jgi:PKD repeat protein
MPADASGRDFVLFDAIRTANGGLVGLGLKKDVSASAWEVYFVRMDSDGQVVGNPKQIAPAAGLPISWTPYDSKAAFITEAFNGSGGSIGYFVAVNLGDGTDQDIWAAMLSPQGCVTWGKRLGATGDGNHDKAVGVYRSPSNEYLILGARNAGITGTMILHSFNPEGSDCFIRQFPGSFVPRSMTPLTSGFGAAAWAVCGMEEGSNLPSVVLLNANFQEINSFGDTFTPNQNSPGPHIPADVVQRGSSLYVLGYSPSNNGKGWMTRLTYMPSGSSDLTFIYSILIDVPNDPAFGVQRDVPWDMETKNDTLAIAGWTHYSDPSNPYRPWAMTMNESGVLLSTKRMTQPGSPYGLLHKIVNLPNRGFFLAGQKWSLPGASGGAQAYMAGCDKNLVVGNCICNEDQPISVQYVAGEIDANFDFSAGSALPCMMTETGGACDDDEATQQVCFTPDNAGCTVVIYLDEFNPCTGEATLSAYTSGMSPPIGFQWSLFNGQMPTSQSINVTFPSSGTFEVSVAASDGNCNASITEDITVEFDSESPQINCPGSKIVNGVALPGGGCSAVVFGLDPQIEDDCPPVDLTYVLSGATTGSGVGNASGITFNEGITLVTYTATDGLGLKSDCSFTVEVDCDNLNVFGKIYGDENPNLPTKVKAFGEYMYIAGLTEIDGEAYGTFSKFDPSTGELVWDFQLAFPSTISDFEYIPANESNIGIDGFLVVGRTEPASSGGLPVNNHSIIFRLNDLGAAGNLGSLMREYELAGREGFTRIIKHPAPINPAFPYYVAGVKNAPSSPTPPSENDVVFLMNINQDGMENFVVEYNYSASADDEFYRGLFPLQDGHLALSGNEMPSGSGVLFKVNGGTGAVINSYTYTPAMTIHDGIQLSNGNIVLAGVYAGSDEAFAATLFSDFTPFQAIRFPSISEFREISMDAMGRVYASGEIKATAPPTVAGRLALHRLLIGPMATPAISLDQGISWYLEDKNQNETGWSGPRFFVSTETDLIYYADGRKQVNPSPGFGDFDMLAGAFDLDLNSLCRYEFQQTPAGFPFARQNATMTAQSPAPPHAFTVGFGGGLLDYLSEGFCNGLCVVSFDWQPEGCYGAVFTASASGEPPYQLEWDFGGLGSSTLQNPVFSFPEAGIYTVCLTLTDDTGCEAEYCLDIEITEDLTPFTLSCPPNMVRATDPGKCYATLSIEATVEDDCAPEPVLSYVLSGATTGIEPDTVYEKGVTTVTATAVDGNQSLTCTTHITVADQEDPEIECPIVDPVTLVACEQEIQVFFPDPIVSDNCPGVEFSFDFESGDFFPCGTTFVTATATDAAGNTSECFFPVEVDCSCADILFQSVTCDPEIPNLYHFSIELQNLSGSNTCGLTVVNTQEGETEVTLTTSGPFNNFGIALIEGTIEVTGSLPPAFELAVEISCLCSPGNFETCTLPVSLPVPCCDIVEVADADVCSTSDLAEIPLNPVSALGTITRVSWFVKACSELSFSDIPYQDAFSNTLEPLVIYPSFLSGDICVYAVVYFDNASCPFIISNQATIRLCEPGEWTANSQELCYDDEPVQPGPITLSSPSGCSPFEVEWYDTEGNLAQTGGLTFEPADSLSLSNPDVDCYEDFHYTAIITGPCGEQEVEVQVRIFSANAPKGALAMDPLEELPLCAGEDVTLRFEPGCLEENGTWKWYSSDDDDVYTLLAGAGDNNEVWNSNKLDQDTWFLVETSNGACPLDTVKLLVEVRPALAGEIAAVYDDPCAPEKAELEVVFEADADPDCGISVEWYRNGELIHTVPAPASSPSVFSYGGPELGGHYYAVLKSDCCEEEYQTQVAYLAPHAYAVIEGPCFLCEGEQVTLTGELLNLPPGVSCSYEWTTLGGAIVQGGDSEQIVVEASGIYIFTATCGGCVYTESIEFACGPVAIGGTIETEAGQGVNKVKVDLNIGAATELTDTDGKYLFDNITAGSDYTVTPMLDTLPANGVTTFDMVLIMRHILNVQLLGSPYKIIAADANRSGTVTTLDLVAIRRVILVVEEGFPDNTSWRFVDKDFVFPDPADPFSSVFPEFITFPDLQMSELETDFIAIKIGDVNNTADVSLTGEAAPRTTSGNLVFLTADVGLESGQLYEIPFYGDGRHIYGYQFTFELSDGLELAEVIPGVAGEENFGPALLADGALTVSWNEAAPRSLGLQERQFSLLLMAKKAARLSDLLGISSRYTQAEAYGAGGELLGVQIVFGDGPGQGFALYQNIPNPFTGATRIGFRLPGASHATLTVMDATGRVLAIISGEYGEGYQEVEVRNLSGAGVLYYQLNTPLYSATRKMVLLD